MMGRFACNLVNVDPKCDSKIIPLRCDSAKRRLTEHTATYTLAYIILLSFVKCNPFFANVPRYWIDGGEKRLTWRKYGAIIYPYKYYYIIGEYPVLAEVKP